MEAKIIKANIMKNYSLKEIKICTRQPTLTLKDDCSTLNIISYIIFLVISFLISGMLTFSFDDAM